MMGSGCCFAWMGSLACSCHGLELRPLIVPSSSASENQGQGARHQVTAWQSIFSAAGLTGGSSDRVAAERR
jgi:hypothetical protein